MSIHELKQRKRQELQLLQREVRVSEEFAQALRISVHKIRQFSEQDKQSPIYQSFYPELRELIGRIFDYWSGLMDKIEKLKSEIQRLENFRDLDG